MVMGGKVKGGQMHGQYPPDFTDDGPVGIGRGRLIPTHPWESMWNPISEWMGVDPNQVLQLWCGDFLLMLVVCH